MSAYNVIIKMDYENSRLSQFSPVVQPQARFPGPVHNLMKLWAIHRDVKAEKAEEEDCQGKEKELGV